MSWAEVKHALNSTLGTEDFQSLDKLFSTRLAEFESIKNKKYIWDTSGTYYLTVPDGIYKIYVTACAGGGGGGGRFGDTDDNTRIGGSGGGGGMAIMNHPVIVTAGEQLSIIVGRGGTAGRSSGSSISSVTSGGDGESTALTRENDSFSSPTISLAGGKGGTFAQVAGGYESNGGAAGGVGGGAGGDGRNYNGSTNIYAKNGSDGLIGKGGEADQNYYGGGGGSLGNGGGGSDSSSYYPKINPTYGGGGGGGGPINSYGQVRNAQEGADGYMLISFVEITEADIVPASSVTSYTETELMSAYREGVESIG
ncbi:glycine-rich domain-containing protein [Roseburia hominis]|uniref:glycine-rich domain-containing protein n=1 Tax=Roseburia hominis TaxID=301301 RepID=UPI0024333549|nr:hypothetical protein [Roseburia hominis]